MSVVVAVVIVVLTAGSAIAVMLFVRRGAPGGGYFNDGDRAAGVFGVLATGFSVLLGFVVFLAFTSYDVARAGAEDEARTVAQQVQSAQLLPDAVTEELVAELVCYARSVAGVQWDRMQDGSLGEELNFWAVELFRTIETVDPQSVTEQAAYSQWLDQTLAREAARQDRVHGAVGVIPTPLWIVLFFITAVIFVFMLFFADSGERALVQGVLMGSVVSVISATMLLLFVLDHPFRAGIGGLEPVAMERTLQVIDEEIEASDLTVTIPCDAAGVVVG